MDAEVDASQLLAAVDKRPRRVLVVDDDATIRQVLRLNFEAEGYDVHVATGGEEAKEMARAIHPDIVVLDVMMPGTDGYSVLRSLRSSPQTDDIPVMLLSARASDDEVFQGWQSGADCYVTKPFELEEVLRIVADIVAASKRAV